MTDPHTETESNFRVTVKLLGSGWAAVVLCDVTRSDTGEVYTDVFSTGDGRFHLKESAIMEARQIAEDEGIPYIPA